MRLSFSGLYAVVALAASAAVLFMDPLLGTVHLVGTVVLLVPVRLARADDHARQALLLVSGTLWITHMVRPLVLIPRPELFSFLRLGVPDRSVILQGLQVTVLGSAALLGGVWVGFRLIRGRHHADRTYGRPGLIVRNRGAWAFIVCVIAAAMALTTAGLGVGVLGAEATRWSFLNRLIPEILVYPVALLLVVRYRDTLGSYPRWIVYLALILVTAGYFLRGSKAFLIYLAVAFVIFVLVDHGDVRLRVRQWGILMLLAGVLLPLTFVIGQEFRIQRNRNALAASDAVIAAVQNLTAGSQATLLGSVNLLTLRLVGYDGVLAVGMDTSAELRRVFSPQAIARGIVGQVIPGMPVQGLSAGKTIAVSYRGHDEDVVHADAIGILSSATLTAGRWSGLYLFLLGFALAAAHRLAVEAKDPDVRFLLRYAAMYFSVTIVMSGVLDRQIALLFITSVQIVAIAAFVGFLNGALGRRSPVNA